MTTVLALVVALLAPSSDAILDLNLIPSDAAVFVDGKQVKPIKGRLQIGAGTHKVAASKSGYRTVTKVITLKAGQVEKVTIKLPKASAKSPSKRPTTAKSPSKRPSKRPSASPSKRPTKRPVAKRPTKRPVAKAPAKRPVKKPVTRTPTKRPSKAPTVGKRPTTSPRPGARPASPQPVRDEAAPSQPSYRGYAIVSFLIGGAALAGGAYMGTQADESADEFNRSVDRFEKQDLKDDTEFNATAANVLYAVGAGGVILGALLWAAEPDYRAMVTPMPGGGTYVGFEGRF